MAESAPLLIPVIALPRDILEALANHVRAIVLHFVGLPFLAFVSAICSSTCSNGGICSAPDVCDCTGTGYDGVTCDEGTYTLSLFFFLCLSPGIQLFVIRLAIIMVCALPPIRVIAQIRVTMVAIAIMVGHLS